MADETSKLPKWAQNKIAYLERQLEDKENQIRQMGGTESNVIWSTGFSDKHCLPKDAGVTFLLGDGMEISVYITNDGLRVSSLSGRLFVSPSASNMVYLNTKR